MTIRILMAKPGLDGHDRGALVVSQALRDHGMEVIYTGLRQSPEQIVQAAIQEDVDAIGLSSLSGAHNILFPEVLNQLKEKNAEDIFVFGGGVIPFDDVRNLEELGIKKVFTPGSSTEAIAAFIEQTVREREAFEPILSAPKCVDHIGIAVSSIDEAIPFYRDHLHLDVETVVDVPEQGVKVAFISLSNAKIELLEPLTKESPVQSFIDKKGEGLHHIALAVNRLSDRLTQLKREGVPLVDETPKQGASGVPIAFLHPKAANGTLVELCENEGVEIDG
ncbi:methylmalonyl-CoA epimerase [Texcoconibacillus texcoconensis]|uniref:Methylmalonyl-CoA mutase C-terminal domain/subunit n=1 Tax=Texcoconibacillus texcoconensis TaxID=1095777 RepID=A0A840QNU7_9BACI|nr:methylmalonyl-CoA mutase C-terminal domain/subunit [Texcoconibacillus texcoconensis]